MANEEKKHDCCERVNGSGRFGGVFNQHRCTKKAKFRRLVNACNQTAGRLGFHDTDTIEYRWFCTVHDPVSIRERENKKDAERIAEYKLRCDRLSTERTRQQLVDAVVGKLTNAQLIWLAARMDEDKDLQTELRDVK